MNKSNKFIFNEIFYRMRRKEWINNLKDFKIIMSIYGMCLLLIITIISLYFYTGEYKKGDITGYLIIGQLFFHLGFISILLLYAFIYLKSYWPWITIDNHGIWINTPKGCKRLLDKKHIQKIVIDLKKERIIIYYDGKKIIFRRDINLLNARFLSHDQFERFKKAMEVLGVEYEIIYR